MAEIEVIHPGVRSLVQDDGRPGLAFYGIPASGHLDPDAAHRANRVLGNPVSSPLIECHLVAPKLRFRDQVDFAVSGADFGWALDSVPVERDRMLSAASGSVLTGAGATNGARGYVAIRGRLDCRFDHASAATYGYAGLGGVEGRPLLKGDILRVLLPEAAAAGTNPGARPSVAAIEARIGILPGPEWHLLTDDAHRELLSASFSISMNSDRMGARLEGPALAIRPASRMATVPLLPGTVQVPGSGAPIVVLADGQTTGGYPRVAILPRGELSKFCQLLPGRAFGFRQL